MLLYNERLPLLLAIITGAAMVGVTAWQVYSFVLTKNQRAVLDETQPITRNASAVGQPPEIDLASLTLFGIAGEDGAVRPEETENLPETNLRLYLRGVLAAEGEFPGSALIEDQKGNTEAYPVGDELPGNATLRSVHPNRVVIERGGKLENLFFPENEDRSGISFAASDEEEQQQTTPVSRSSTAPSRQPSPDANDEQRREEIRRRLEQLRERLRNNSN
ncbi:type II secretion system protein N [Marinobacter sp. M216]|uniref:Type II secretion system protein N n=1 Tax=Marinobacter albus TaxID=3030833 RepID=A0ABT7HCA6_9GAMM|nr:MULTISPECIES: type II secretion system protein N [unclassified Marinobacter]MBW7469762.1 general secretion pathway protein GspC [Marinobacter sp. F4218]MDK9557979.1 type II secretion system protein N [Marinobacter sp. M216]